MRGAPVQRPWPLPHVDYLPVMATISFLRVRDSGPSMGQTVTTGSSFTVWLMF